MFVKVEVKFEKKPYLCNELTNSYTFGITTLSINLSNLDKIVYCENITTYIKSHLNRKYAIDFFPKSLQEKRDRNYTKRIS